MTLTKLQFDLGVVEAHDGMEGILDHKGDMDLVEDIPVVDSLDNAVDILLYKAVDAVEDLVDLGEEEAVALDQVEMMVSLELDLLIILLKI